MEVNVPLNCSRLQLFSKRNDGKAEPLSKLAQTTLCIEQVARAQRPLGLFSFRDIWINLNRSRKRHENKSSPRSDYFLVHCDDKGLSEPPGFLPDLVLGLHEALVDQRDVVCLP